MYTQYVKSSSRGERAAISQSSTAIGSKSRYRTLPIQEWRPQTVGDDPVVVRAPVADVTAERGGLGTVEVERGELALRLRDAVKLRDDGERRVLQRALLLARGVEQPIAAERVGHEIRRDHAVALLHHEERRAQHVGVALEPMH